MNATRAIPAFYLFAASRALIPIYPLYAVMFLAEGITAVGLASLIAIWSSVVLLAEVPSGALADRTSRKRLVLVGMWMKAAAFLIWYVWRDYWGFAAGFVCWGLGSSLRSGAQEALMYEMMQGFGREADFPRFYGVFSSLTMLSSSAGQLAGGMLIFLGYDTVLLISAVMPIVSTIPIMIFVAEPTRRASPDQRNDYWATLASGVRVARDDRRVVYILLVSMIVLVVPGIFDEFASPTFAEAGFSLEYLGYFGALNGIAAAAGMAVSHRLRATDHVTLLCLAAVAGVVLACATFRLNVWLVAGIAVFFFLFAIVSTSLQVQLQTLIDSETRATVTSVVALGEEAGGIIFIMAFGFIAGGAGMIGAMRFAGVGTVITASAFIVLARVWQLRLQAQDG